MIYCPLTCGGCQRSEAERNCSSDRFNVSSDLEAVKQVMGSFASNLLKNEINGHPDDNLLLSPISAFLILGITSFGAPYGENTHEQLRHVLFEGMHQKQIIPSLSWIKSELRPLKGSEISIANLLFVGGGKLFQPFVETVKCLDGSIEAVDFKRNEFVTEEINTIVKRKTRGKIVDLIDSIHPLTKLLLVNSVYFKGEWLRPFTANAETLRDSFVTKNGILSVDMMITQNQFHYFEDANTQVLGIPYSDNSTVMYVFLPRVGSKFDSQKLNEYADKVVEQQVRVQLPKFNVTSDTDLRPSLESMGVHDIFSAEKANLHRMFSQPRPKGMFVSKLLHQATIEVNERGSEAAAATAVLTVPLSSVHTAPPRFVANRPFVFAVRHLPTGVWLFVGQFARPSQGSRSTPAVLV